jgi:hypothetical protein
MHESWFDFFPDREMIWLEADDKVPETAQHSVQSTKLTLTIVWNLSSFHLINIPSK